jgi:hypothetical protein
MDLQFVARRNIRVVYVFSALVCLGVAISSAVGLLLAGSDSYGHTGSVLVSPGADVANLMLVPLVLCCLLASSRGSLIGLLLLPGGLFYALYAYIPFLIGTRFTAILLDHVAITTFSAFGIASLLAGVKLELVRQRIAAAPAVQIASPSLRWPFWPTLAWAACL